MDVYFNTTLYTDSQRMKEVWSRQFMSLAVPDYELLVPLVQQDKPHVIVADIFSFGAKMVAKDYNIPLIGSNPSIFPQPMASAAYPSISSHKIFGQMSLLDRLFNSFSGFAMIPVFMELIRPISEY